MGVGVAVEERAEDDGDGARLAGTRAAENGEVLAQQMIGGEIGGQQLVVP